MKLTAKSYKTLGWFFALAMYVLATINLLQTEEKMLRVAQNAPEAFPLDLYFMGLDANRVHSAFTAMGAQSLLIYKKIEAHDDIVYPLAYTFLFLLTILFLGQYLQLKRKNLILFCSIPLVTLFADFFENFYILKMIEIFPEMDENNLASASLANKVKWVSAVANIQICVAFGGLSAQKWYRLKLAKK